MAERHGRDVERPDTPQLPAEVPERRTVELLAGPEADASGDVGRNGSPPASIQVDCDTPPPCYSPERRDGWH